MHVHFAQFRTALQSGKHFAGIEPVAGVKGAFDALLLFQINRVEHGVHQVTLLHAHAMLAGQHAADRNAEFQNIRAAGLGLFRVAGLIGVIEDQGVQIAIAGMEDIGDAQAVPGGNFLHLAQHQTQLVARNGAVHAQIIRANRRHCRKGVFAPGPELQPLLLALRHF